MKRGITHYGGYNPRLRMSRDTIFKAHAWMNPGLRGASAGMRSFGDWDEDPITFGVEAVRDALPERARNSVERFILCSTSSPFAYRQNATIAAAALNLDPSVQCLDVGGSDNAALIALAQACQNQGAATLIAASERVRTPAMSLMEMRVGDGGAALRIGEENVLAMLVGEGHVSEDFIDRHRASSNDFDYLWEERWIRDEGFSRLVAKAAMHALNSANLKAEQINHLIAPSYLPNAQTLIARKLGIDEGAIADHLMSSCGYVGSAHGLLVLSSVLSTAKPGDRILIVQMGQGATALIFEVTEKIETYRSQRGVASWLARAEVQADYLKLAVFNRVLDWDRGMRGERDTKTAYSALNRDSAAITGLIAGKCRKTGVVQFKPSRLSVAPNETALDSFEPYPLSEKSARVVSFSADRLSFSLHPPSYVGLIDFDGGGRMPVQFTDIGSDGLDTGDRMRMVFRIKDFDEQRGFRRYFWKAQPFPPLQPEET
ncbi:MAG: OB-fold domain-containing protein [Pseudomonadota bacterium]